MPGVVTRIAALGLDALDGEHTTDGRPALARVGQGTNRAYPGMTTGFFEALAAEVQRQGFGVDDAARIGGGEYAPAFAKVTSAS